jgi:hypothetical protein
MSERRRRGIIDLLLDRVANRPRLLLHEEREAGAGEAAAGAERPARAEESPGLSLSSPPAPAPPAAPPPEAPAAEAPPARTRRARRSRSADTDYVEELLIVAGLWGRAFENPSLAESLGEYADEMLGGSGDVKQMFMSLAAARGDDRINLTMEFFHGLAGTVKC